MAKILIAEDDHEFAALVKQWLGKQNHTVDIAHTGTEAEEFIGTYTFDLFVLDWDLPGTTGVEICRKLRQNANMTPVLMLTGKTTVDDKGQGFDAGADDYLTKPVDLRELGMRVGALLRRAPVFRSTTLATGNITLDCRTREVKRKDKPVALMPREFALFEYLLKHKSVVFSSEQLLDAVWSSDSEASPHTVRSCINRIRDKLDTAGQPSVIRTVYSVGYTIDE
ncbi:MAG: response regulator transcription factor [Candidatus Obscuribacterales bacterium]|nr:response regulator transcription factor [Candidatus Obscuribacterales bacterium]